MSQSDTWITCQIGAREHYAIPRALHQRGQLGLLVTDFWIPPSRVMGGLPGLKRLRDRYHDDLSGVPVVSQNLPMLSLEARQRFRRSGNWTRNIQRNQKFQDRAIRQLEKAAGRLTRRDGEISLFSYSYAAVGLFRFAREKGWKTVLGQIDPGPEEERIVQREHQRYPHLASCWQPAPASYWEGWREEVELADRIIVNSEWSRQCLMGEGVSEEKLEVIPLVYDGQRSPLRNKTSALENHEPRKDLFQVLFLGQVNLRKGMGRLLEAMRLLKDSPIALKLVGPSEIAASEWADLPWVSWVGPVSRSEVVRHYEEADAFVLPTLSDGYAITQLEALSRGLPVLASERCGSAVIDGVNGRILKSLEPSEIAATLREMAEEKFPEVAPPRFGLHDLAEALAGLD